MRVYVYILPRLHIYSLESYFIKTSYIDNFETAYGANTQAK